MLYHYGVGRFCRAFIDLSHDHAMAKLCMTNENLKIAENEGVE